MHAGKKRCAAPRHEESRDAAHAAPFWPVGSSRTRILYLGPSMLRVAAVAAAVCRAAAPGRSNPGVARLSTHLPCMSQRRGVSTTAARGMAVQAAQAGANGAAAEAAGKAAASAGGWFKVCWVAGSGGRASFTALPALSPFPASTARLVLAGSSAAPSLLSPNTHRPARHTPPSSHAGQDFASGKLRLLLAAGLGLLAINAGASAAFDWYYKRQGARGPQSWMRELSPCAATPLLPTHPRVSTTTPRPGTPATPTLQCSTRWSEACCRRRGRHQSCRALNCAGK